MVDKLILKNTIDANKAPSLTQLGPGEIGINRNEVSPGLYIRTGTGAESPTDKIVRIGPIYIGASEPAVVGGTGVTIGSSWLHSTTQRLSVFTSQGWVAVRGRSAVVAANPPTQPIEGDLWFDTEIAALKVWIAAAAAWVEVSSSSKVSVYFGESDPRVSSDQISFVGFKTETDGLYYGQKDFRGLNNLTANLINKPVNGFAAGQEVVIDSGTRIYQKTGTKWYCWRRAGYWYLAEASTTSINWFRSSTSGAASPELVAGWVLVIGDETTPVKAGTNVAGFNVVRATQLQLAIGETWFDSDNEGFKIWTGTSWLSAGVSKSELARVTPKIVGEISYASNVNWTITNSRFLVPSASENLTGDFFEKLSDHRYRVKRKGLFTIEVALSVGGLTGGASGTVPSYIIGLYRATKDELIRVFYANNTSGEFYSEGRSMTLLLDKGEDLQLVGQGLTLSSISRTVTISASSIKIVVLHDLEA